ncbi:MAG: imidazole glycerol phosphate synthase subunit HisH [Candidatus Omnitrophota bacterium]
MIVVIDYGTGNLHSVVNAMRVLGASVKISQSPNIIDKAKKLILPGVGHFGEAVRKLRKMKIFYLIKKKIERGVPFLGICVGMQLLFESSAEDLSVSGLGLIKGKVKKFASANLIVPHMGWNQITLNKNRSGENSRKLFKGIKCGSFFYFAHSYYCSPFNKDLIVSFTDYGGKFASAVNKDNIWAVQFHPEKSQVLGLDIFRNFIYSC